MPAFTPPRTYGIGEILRAAWLNLFHRDNLLYLKGRLLAQWPAHGLLTRCEAPNGAVLLTGPGQRHRVLYARSSCRR